MDPIKDLFNSYNKLNPGIFIDEQDFANQLSKDPKGVYDLAPKGFFIDYADFENISGIKKKIGGEKRWTPSGPTPPSPLSLLLPSHDQVATLSATDLIEESDRVNEVIKADTTPIPTSKNIFSPGLDLSQTYAVKQSRLGKTASIVKKFTQGLPIGSDDATYLEQSAPTAFNDIVSTIKFNDKNLAGIKNPQEVIVANNSNYFQRVQDQIQPELKKSLDASKQILLNSGFGNVDDVWSSKKINGYIAQADANKRKEIAQLDIKYPKVSQPEEEYYRPEQDAYNKELKAIEGKYAKLGNAIGELRAAYLADGIENDPFVIGMEYLQYSDPIQYANRIKAGSETVIDNNIAKKGNQIRIAVNKNPLTLQQILKDDDFIDDRFTMGAEQDVLHRLAAEHYKESNRFWYNPPTIQQLDDYKNQLPAKEKALYERTIRPRLIAKGMPETEGYENLAIRSVFGYSPEIPLSGGLNAFTGSLFSLGESTGKGIAGVMGFRTESDKATELINNPMLAKTQGVGQSPEAIARINDLNDKEKKGKLSLEELNEREDLKSYTNIMSSGEQWWNRSMALAGQVVGQAVLSRGLGGALVGGASKLGVLASEGASVVAGGVSTGVLSAEAINATAASVIGFASSVDDASKQGMELGIYGVGNTIFSTVVGAANAVTENIFKDAKVLDAFNKEIAQQVLSVVEKLGVEGMSRELFQNSIKAAIKNAVKYTYLTELEASKEVVEETATTAITQAAIAALAPDQFSVKNAANDVGQTIISTFLDGQVVAAFAGIGEYRATKIGITTLSKLGVDKEFTTNVYNAIDAQFKNGVLTEEQAKEKKSILNNIAMINSKSMPEVKKIAPKLSDNAFKKYAVALAYENSLKEKKNASDDEALNQTYDQKIKESVDLRKAILAKQVFIDDKFNVYATQDSNISEGLPEDRIVQPTRTEAGQPEAGQGEGTGGEGTQQKANAGDSTVSGKTEVEVQAGIKAQFPFVTDADFVKEAYTPQEDEDDRNALPDSGIPTEQDLKDLLEKGEYAVLSGQNPSKTALSKAANKQLNEKAVEWLKARGLNAIAVFGKYGNSERSFLVPKMTQQQAVEFAKEFQQEAVAHSTGMVYPNGTIEKRLPGVSTSNYFDKKDDNYTSVNVGGKAIDFKLNFDFGNRVEIKPTTQEQSVAEEDQFEPLTIKGTTHETFTRDNASDYEEDEKEGNNGRVYTYLSRITVPLVDDFTGDTVGYLVKIVDEDGIVSWQAEDVDNQELSEEEFDSKKEAQQAIIDAHNDQRLKEFNEEKKARESAKEKEAKSEQKKKDSSNTKTVAQKAKDFLVGTKEELKKNLDNLQKALRATGIKVLTPATSAEYDAIIKNRNGQENTEGIFFDSSGEIVLNMEKLEGSQFRDRVIWHEGSHPVLNILRNTNPKLYQRVLDGLNQLAKTNPDVAESLDYAEQYRDRTEGSDAVKQATVNDEFVTETTAMMADGTIDLDEIPDTVLQKVFDFLNEAAKLLGIKGRLYVNDKVAAKKIMKEIANALTEGKNVASVVGKKNVKEFQSNLDSSKIITQEDPSTLSQASINRSRFGPKIMYNKDGYKLSNVKESDLIDIESFINKVAEEDGKIWFWTADQLGRGIFSDETLDEEHYLDAGPSFALDPKNRDKNIIWASGLKKKSLNKYIDNSDYIFIISGSPQQSQLFNKQVIKYFAKEIDKKVGGWDKFKEDILKISKVKGINKILNKYNTFNDLIDQKNSDRKKLFIALQGQLKSKNSNIKQYLLAKGISLDSNKLRDGFYKENNFNTNDILLVLKPTAVGGKSDHSTYENNIMGKVIGVPNKRINGIDILPDERQIKYKEKQRLSPLAGAVGSTTSKLGQASIERRNIRLLFNTNSQLAQVGTQEQYSEYINGIFPKSEVKDIVYHRTSANYDKFDKSKIKSKTGDSNRFYFSPIDTGRYGNRLVTAILDIKKLAYPYSKKFIDEVNEKHPEYTKGKSKWFNLSSQIYVNPDKYGYDGVFALEGTNDDEYSVLEPEQIHILGDENDIKGFKDYVKTSRQASVDSKENVSESVQPIPSEDKTGLVLYHGSPHSFENFDISKLGSGEGQQKFGHGLYFTNKEEIAKGYANVLGSKKNFWEALQNGQELSLSKDDYNFIKNELDSLGFDGERAENADLGNILVDGKEEYAPEVLDAMSVLFGKNPKSELADFDLSESEINRLLQIKKKISDPQFYKVSVHEGKSPSEYDYIEWADKLTDSQRKKIGKDFPENITGKEAYKELSKKLGSDKQASEYLLSKGIDGIVFKSEKGTGGKTGEGRNYVIFDPKSIRIDEINNQKQPPKEGQASIERGLKNVVKDNPEIIKSLLPNTKIVNKEGVPIQFYHGTRGEGDFTNFEKGDIGFHFGYKDTAKQRGDVLLGGYLNIENPINIEDKGAFEGQEFVDSLYEAKVLDKKEYEYFTNEFDQLQASDIYGYDTGVNNELREIINKKGYDGFIYTNKYESGSGKSVIALYPDQIVFADGRNIENIAKKYLESVNNNSNPDLVSAVEKALTPTGQASVKRRLAENKTAKTQTFFSNVVKGENDKYKPKKDWQPLMKFREKDNAFNRLYSNFKGNFDTHIATSIPGFRDVQVKKGIAMASLLPDGGLIYDIGGSEGGLIKAVTKMSAGKIKSINVDVNEDMQKAFAQKPVAGSKFVNEAFLEPYEENGKVYPAHVPEQKADIVHESMVFQFISPEREQFIDEIADNYVTEDGVVILEEKVQADSDAVFAANEKFKDENFKLEYYDASQLDAKREEVLTGMKENQTQDGDLINALQSRFKFVSRYWDSGNFKGYVASNNEAKVNKFMKEIGDTDTKFTTKPTGPVRGQASIGRQVKVESPELLDIKNNYVADNKITTPQVENNKKFTPEDIDRVADMHENATDDRKSPEVLKTYNAFMDETKKQYELLVEQGYKIEPWLKEGEPYGVDSSAVREDVNNNKHLFYLRSKSATGVGETDMSGEDYILFKETGIKLNGDNVLYNDLFRAVHDILGHCMYKNSFSTQGEFQAYLTHSNMFSEDAQSALFLETVSYNAYYSKNKEYAPRKMYVVPKEEIASARGTSGQASISRIKTNKNYKLAAFVMRMKQEGASKGEIALAVASVNPTMSATKINDLIDDPEKFITDSFPGLSNDVYNNIIERAKVENIYRGLPSTTSAAFAGLQVPSQVIDDAIKNRKNKANAFAEAVKDFKANWLNPNKGLPDWVLSVRDMAKGTKDIEIARATKLMEQIKSTAKKIGFTDWNAFELALKAVNQLAPVQPTSTYNISPAVLPQALQNIPSQMVQYAIAMRAQVDRLTKDLIGNGYITPIQAVNIEQNIGSYFNRAYKMFTEKDYKPSGDHYNAAVKYIADIKVKQIATNNPTLPIDEAYNEATRLAMLDVDGILNKKKNPYFNTGKSDSRNTGILKERKDIPVEIRNLMGEYTDPGTIFIMTVAKQASLKAQSECLYNMRKLGLGTLFFEKNDPKRPLGYSSEIANTGSEAKNPLGGLYTTPEILEQLEAQEPTLNAITNMYLKLVGSVKWGKTVGSVITQFKNFESNVGFAVMNGLLLSNIKESFGGAGKYVSMQFGKKDIDLISEKCIQLGLVGQSIGARELKDMLGSGDLHEIALQKALGTKGKFAKELGKKVDVIGFANKLYRLGDDFWKVYAYLNERQSLSDARYGQKYDDLTPSEQKKIDVESSERVKNTWPTYDRVVDAVKVISKSIPILGNFVSFQAESIRCLNNTIKMAISDMKDPELRALGVKRLAGISAYITMRTTLTYLAAQAAGIAYSGILSAFDDDEEKQKRKRAFKNAMPFYTKPDDLLTIPTKDPAEFIVYSLSSLDPYGIVPNTLNAFTNGSNKTEPGFTAGIVEFMSTFLEPEMTFQTASSISNNINLDTGKPIWGANDDMTTAIGKGFAFLFKKLEPSTLSTIKRVYNAEDKSPELLAAFGARPMTINFNESFKYKLSEMEKQMIEVANEYNSIKYNPKMTPEEIDVAEKNAETKKSRILEKFHQIYGDYLTAGASKDFMDNLINQKKPVKVTGFDNQTKNSIKTGIFTPDYLFK